MAIPSAQQPVYNGPTQIDVTRHTIHNAARLAEVTTSANGGGTLYAHVIRDPSWTIETPIDDAGFIEDVLDNTGNVIDELQLQHTSGTGDLLESTTVESITKVVDSTSDVPRVSISGRGGVITSNNPG